MKTPAKEECKSCDFGYMVNSEIVYCIASDCEAMRKTMQKINENRKRRQKGM